MQKNKKRQFIIVPAILVLLTIGVSSAFASSYPDVKSGYWARHYIEEMSKTGVITGYPDGTFRPEETVTYGEFIKMAVLVGTDEKIKSSAASSENWAQGYYEKALEKKYFTTGEITKEALDQLISRRCMALIAAGILGEGVQVTNFSKLESEIVDVNADTKYEYAIVRAYSMGLLSGYPDGTFRPDGTLTRAEASAVIKRLTDEQLRIRINKEKKKEEPVSKSGLSPEAEGKYDGFQGRYGLSENGEIYVVPNDQELLIPVAKSGALTEMIDNPEWINERGWDVSYQPKTKFILAASSDPFEFEIREKAVGIGIFGEGRGLSHVIFVKDHHIIGYGGFITNPNDWRRTSFEFADIEQTPSINYTAISDVPEFDYIGSFTATSTGGEYLLLIPNPWKSSMQKKGDSL